LAYPSVQSRPIFISNADASLCEFDFGKWQVLQQPLTANLAKLQKCETQKRTTFLKYEKSCNRSARTSRSAAVQTRLCQCMQRGLNTLARTLHTACKLS